MNTREGSRPRSVPDGILQEASSDDHPVDFVGSVVDSREAGFAVHVIERGVRRHAQGTVYLDRAIDHIVKHSRSPKLDE